jgi:Domain of unknown function (DUF4157)/Novel toxin 15
MHDWGERNPKQARHKKASQYQTDTDSGVLIDPRTELTPPSLIKSTFDAKKDYIAQRQKTREAKFEQQVKQRTRAELINTLISALPMAAQRQSEREANLSLQRQRQRNWNMGTNKTSQHALARAALQRDQDSTSKANEVRTAYTSSLERSILQRMINDEVTAMLQPPILQRAARDGTPTLSVIADAHRAVLQRLKEASNTRQEALIQRAKAVGQDLAKSYHSLTAKHSADDFASAILRFTDPLERGAVQNAAFRAMNPNGFMYTQAQAAIRHQENAILQRRDELKTEFLPIAREKAQEDAMNTEGISSRIQRQLGMGQPLPAGIRHQLEMQNRVSLHGVRVHHSSEADQLSKSIGARAFTTGQDIFFASGAYDPDSAEGAGLIGHEVAHTVQQAQRRVAGQGIDPDASLEVEAQRAGEITKQNFQAQPTSSPEKSTALFAPLNASQAHTANLIAQRQKNHEHSTTRDLPIQRSVFDWFKTNVIEQAANIFFGYLKQQGGIGAQLATTFEGIREVLGEVFEDFGTFFKNFFNGAIVGGFNKFTGDAKEHLQNGLAEWLTGAVGVAFPTNFNPQSILGFVMNVTDFNYSSFRKSLIGHIGPGGASKVNQAEQGLELMQNLKAKGPSALAKLEGADSIAGMVKDGAIDTVKDFAMTEVMKRGSLALATKFIPGAGWLSVAQNIVQVVQFLMENGERMAGLVNTSLSAIKLVAKGNVSSAASAVESSLSKIVALGIRLLAKTLGLEKIKEPLKKALAATRKRIDAVIDRITKPVAKLIDRFVSGKANNTVNAKPNNGAPKNASNNAQKLMNGEYGKQEFIAGKEPHAVWLKMRQSRPTVMIASTPKPAKEQLDGWRDEATQKNLQGQVGPYIGQAMSIVNRAVKNLNKAASTTTINAVTIEAMWKSDAKALARVVKTIRDALGPEVNYPFTTDSNGVKRTKLVTISFLCPKELSQAGFRGEFLRQVQGQQEGLNKLTVPEWFTNRTTFLNLGRSNSEQRQYRKENKETWINDRILDIQTRPYSRELLTQLHRVLTATELTNLEDITRTPRVPVARARVIAELIWKRQAALHDPDQNAGGYPSAISGVGDRDVNSSVGSQWKDRVYLIDREVAKIPEVLRPDLHLNTRLRSQ